MEKNVEKTVSGNIVVSVTMGESGNCEKKEVGNYGTEFEKQ